MRKLRSVIVDDNDDIRLMLNVNLTTGPVEVVGEAKDGLEAVQMAHSLKPDVMVMDLVMPHMDGAEATLVIKKQHPETVVIGFTAAPEEADRLRRAGASDVFSKDSLDDLLLTLQEMLPEE